MASFDYTKTRATAGRLIAKFGRTAQLRRYAASTGFDADDREYDEVDVSMVAVSYAKGELPESMIVRGGRRVLIAAEGLSGEVLLSDKLVIGGVEHELHEPLMPLDPAGTVIMYEAQVVL